MFIAQNTYAPTVINGLLGTLSTIVFETTVLFVTASATTPSTVRTDSVPSAMIPAMSSQIVPSLRTPAVVSSSMMETQRESDLALVVQVFEGGIVTVRGSDLIFSLFHLSPLFSNSPFMFTISTMFFADTY